MPLVPCPATPLLVHSWAGPAAHGVRDVPWSWWQLVTSVSAGHTLRAAVGAAPAKGQMGSNSLPQVGDRQKTPQGHKRAAPGSRRSPTPRVLGSSGGSRAKEAAPKCTSSAPHSPQGSPHLPGQPCIQPSWCLLALPWSSTLPCGTLSHWTYQELVGDTEPPHRRCAGAAGSCAAREPSTPPWVNVHLCCSYPAHGMGGDASSLP